METPFHEAQNSGMEAVSAMEKAEEQANGQLNHG
jgi:hypothetical protein